MRDHAREVHQKIVTHPLSRCLSIKMYPLHVQALRDHLEQKTVYIPVLENHIRRLKQTSWAGNDNLQKIAGFFERLFRSDLILNTIRRLDQDKETVSRGVLPAAHEYAEYLTQLADITPEGFPHQGAFLIAHGYTNFLDGLFGGLLVENSIRHKFGAEYAEFLHYPWLFTPGMTVREANPIVEPFVKENFEVPMDALPWTESDIARMKEEAKACYASYLRLTEQLQAHDRDYEIPFNPTAKPAVIPPGAGHPGGVPPPPARPQPQMPPR